MEKDKDRLRRFYDDLPFRQPETPEQADFIKRRNEASDYGHKTGDWGPLGEVLRAASNAARAKSNVAGGEENLMPANDRFSDNPFRDPNLTPEQVERLEERNKALRVYRETGDEGPAIALGLFPAKSEPTYMSYMDTDFTLHRPVMDGPTVDVSIVCASHKHEPYTISLVENVPHKWGYGRKTEGGNTSPGPFKSVVRRSASLLRRECRAITEVDNFFAESTNFCVLEGDESKSVQQIVLPPLKPRSKPQPKDEE